MKVVIPALRQKNILIRTNSISIYLVKNKRPIHWLNTPIQEVTIGSKQRVNQTSLNAVVLCGHLMAAWQTVINACCVFGVHEWHILSLSLRRLDDSMYESRNIEIKLRLKTYFYQTHLYASKIRSSPTNFVINFQTAATKREEKSDELHT